MNRLTEILSTMEIPAMRRNIENDANVRWLIRNLAIQNQQHPHFQEALNLLKLEVAPIYGD